MIGQVSVFLENRVGCLGEVVAALAADGINLRAVSIADASDYGIVRFICDDCPKAVSLLKGRGFMARANDVVAFEVPDEPGGLSRIVAMLSERKIGIEYMYSVFGEKDGMACMVMKVSDALAADGALKSEGVPVADGKTLDFGGVSKSPV